MLRATDSDSVGQHADIDCAAAPTRNGLGDRCALEPTILRLLDAEVDATSCMQRKWYAHRSWGRGGLRKDKSQARYGGLSGINMRNPSPDDGCEEKALAYFPDFFLRRALCLTVFRVPQR